MQHSNGSSRLVAAYRHVLHTELTSCVRDVVHKPLRLLSISLRKVWVSPTVGEAEIINLHVVTSLRVMLDLRSQPRDPSHSQHIH